MPALIAHCSTPSYYTAVLIGHNTGLAHTSAVITSDCTSS